MTEIERGVAIKDVSKTFNVPKKTLSTWKKNRDKIVTSFKSSGGTKRQRIKEGTYVQVNLACFKWLLLQRSENIPIQIHGKIIREKALEFAKELNLEKFQASDGWLHSWKARYNISFKEVSGESKSVTREMTAAWKETSLPTTLKQCQMELYLILSKIQIIKTLTSISPTSITNTRNSAFFLLSFTISVNLGNFLIPVSLQLINFLILKPFSPEKRKMH